jgi:hypothetical protein
MPDDPDQPVPPERISELLLAAARGHARDPELALAIEQASAELTPSERAVVARVLEQAVAITQRRAADLEHEARSAPGGDA